MNQLTTMPAFTGNATPALTMSSREIAELCDKRHDTVLRDVKSMIIDLYGEEHVVRILPAGVTKKAEFVRSNADAILSAIIGDSSKWWNVGVTWTFDQRGYVSEIHLDREHSITLVAGYNVKLRKRIIDRWLELEQQVRAGQPLLPNFANPAEAARAWALQYEQTQALQIVNQNQQAEIESMEPIVGAHLRLTDSSTTFGLYAAAKRMKVKPRELIMWLSFNSWIFKQTKKGRWIAYQNKIDRGLLAHHVTPYKSKNGSKFESQDVYITAKGMSEISRQMFESDRYIR